MSEERPQLRDPNRAPSSIEVKIGGLEGGDRVPAENVFKGFGCEGENRSPEVRWSKVEGAKSYALILHDPDAPTGVGFFHWVVLDLPPETTSLPLGASGAKMPAGAIEGSTDFGATGYGGPCPPTGHGVHRYEFTVYAVDVPSLGLGANATGALSRFALGDHTLALGRATAFYER